MKKIKDSEKSNKTSVSLECLDSEWDVLTEESRIIGGKLDRDRNQW